MSKKIDWTHGLATLADILIPATLAIIIGYIIGWELFRN